MSTFSWGVMALLVLVLGVFGYLAMNDEEWDRSSVAVQDEAKDAHSEVDPNASMSMVTAPADDSVELSSMPSWGIFIAALGFLGSNLVAFLYDVSPYGDLVNIDAVSQRDMAFTAGVAITLTGIIISCTGRIVNAVRMGR